MRDTSESRERALSVSCPRAGETRRAPDLARWERRHPSWVELKPSAQRVGRPAQPNSFDMATLIREVDRSQQRQPHGDTEGGLGGDGARIEVSSVLVSSSNST